MKKKTIFNEIYDLLIFVAFVKMYNCKSLDFNITMMAYKKLLLYIKRCFTNITNIKMQLTNLEIKYKFLIKTLSNKIYDSVIFVVFIAKILIFMLPRWLT